MSPASIEYPLRRKLAVAGSVVDPRILLEVRTTAGYRGHLFLVDTGADFSVVPRRLADDVGLDWESLPVLEIVGVGLGRVPAKLGALQMRFGEIEIAVRCLFTQQGVNPFILGRTDVLDRFALTIDASQSKLVFTELP